MFSLMRNFDSLFFWKISKILFCVWRIQDNRIRELHPHYFLYFYNWNLKNSFIVYSVYAMFI